jgi:hypothetical protein
MGQTTKPTRQNRTITVDFHDETTDFTLLGNTKAFVEFVLAFILSIGFQLIHKANCSEGGSLTRHSHYARVRLGGVGPENPCNRASADERTCHHAARRS